MQIRLVILVGSCSGFKCTRGQLHAFAVPVTLYAGKKISWYKKAASIWNVRLIFFYTVQVKEYHRTTTNQYLQDHKLVIIFIFSLNPNLCIFFLVKSLFLHLLMVNTCEHPYFSWVSMKIPHGNPVETHESPMTHHERSPRNPIRSLNHRQKSIKHH